MTETAVQVARRQGEAAEVARLKRVLKRTLMSLATHEAILDDLEIQAGVPLPLRTTLPDTYCLVEHTDVNRVRCTLAPDHRDPAGVLGPHIAVDNDGSILATWEPT